MFNIGLTALYIHCDGFHFFYITFFHPDGLKCSGATLVYSIFQNVCIERFYVSCVDVYMINSVLLVLHSPVFEDLIYSGAEEIILDQSLQFPGAEMMIYQCLLYLYGDTVTINLDQVLNIHHFASVYKETKSL